jgi:hypothetical protein
MNRITLFVTITVGLAALPIPVFSQAAAESALINATSSLSTVNASSHLNRALNQSSGQLARRIQQIAPTSTQRLTQGHGQKVVLRSQVSTAGVRADSPGPMIVSIRGGEVRRSSR